jgi:GT2 family glycosyltransferase
MPDRFPIPLEIVSERLQPLSEAVLIVPSYRAAAVTAGTLGEVLRLNPPGSFDLLVVDNGGEDVDEIRRALSTPHLQTIVLRQNAGPAGAFYVGMKRALEAGYRYFVLSDNDTELLTENGIGVLISKLPADGLGVVAPTSLARGRPSSGDERVSRAYWEFFTLGRAAVERVGLVDPALFWGIDDYDYAMRLVSAGVPIVRTPDCRCYHPLSKPSALYNWSTYSLLRGYLLVVFSRRPSPLAFRLRLETLAAMCAFVGARLLSSLRDPSIARTLAIAARDAARGRLTLELPANNFRYEQVACAEGRWIDLEGRLARLFPRRRYRVGDPRGGESHCFERRSARGRAREHGPATRLDR